MCVPEWRRWRPRRRGLPHRRYGSLAQSAFHWALRRLVYERREQRLRCPYPRPWERPPYSLRAPRQSLLHVPELTGLTAQGKSRSRRCRHRRRRSCCCSCCRRHHHHRHGSDQAELGRPQARPSERASSREANELRSVPLLKKDAKRDSIVTSFLSHNGGNYNCKRR